MAFKHRVFSGLGIAGIVFLTVAAYASYAAIVDHNWAAGLLAVVLAGFGGDAVHFELNYAWTNGGLQERYKLWKKRRFWAKRQTEHLLIMLSQDQRWMASNPIVAALTERYIRALGVDWYKEMFESSDKLRTKLKLDPVYGPDAEQYVEHLVMLVVVSSAIGAGSYVVTTHAVPSFPDDTTRGAWATRTVAIERGKKSAFENPNDIWSHQFVKVKVPVI